MELDEDYVLGIDIGTSSTKSIVYTLKGEIKFQTQIRYETKHPKPGYSEQDPEDILGAVVGVIQAAVHNRKKQPLCLSFSCAMHSLMAVDKKGKPISSLLIWSDNRSIHEARQLRQSNLAQEIYNQTGTPIHAMSPLTKLLWWKDNDKESFGKAAKFLSILEYVFSEFLGEYVVGYSLASATGLFNHATLEWNSVSLDLVGIGKEKLSEPVSPLHMIKSLKSEMARKSGLLPDIPFVMGAADGCLANLGTGVTNPGEIAVTIGTSGAVRLFSSQSINDPQGRIFNYLLLKGEFISGGAINNGGVLLDWYRWKFLKDNKITYEKIQEEAFSAEPGCGGLLFLPYLQGERSPMWDGKARGAFVGISNMHERKDFSRAVIEGICYSLFHTASLLNQTGEKIKEIYVSGGFTRSADWVQMMTDLFNKKTKIAGKGDASSIGACLLGMRAIGVIDSWEEAEQFLPIVKTYQPHENQTTIYRRNFELFSRLYDTLKSAMHQISDWQSSE